MFVAGSKNIGAADEDLVASLILTSYILGFILLKNLEKKRGY
jgi:hypothetical protein